MTISNPIYPPVINSGTGVNYPQISPSPTPTPNGSWYTLNTNSSTSGVITGTGLGIGQTQQSGITVMAPDGEAIITFHTDGRIETKGGTIQARDLTAVIKLMKRMMTDIATDEELAKKFPYIKDAAHEWVMDELRK